MNPFYLNIFSINYTWFLHLKKIDFVPHFSWFGGHQIIYWPTCSWKILILSCCATEVNPPGFAYSSIQASRQLYSLDSCTNYFHKLKVSIAKQLQSNLTSQQCHLLFLKQSFFFKKNGILTILLIFLTCKCA